MSRDRFLRALDTNRIYSTCSQMAPSDPSLMSPPSKPPGPESFTPLRPAIFLILLSLGDVELHGYAIAKEVQSRSAGKVRIATGPMYRHLKRLLDAQLIEESDKRPSPEDDDERRRYYRLTEAGRAALMKEADRLAGLVAAARDLRLREA